MDTHTQNYLNMCRRVSYFFTANEQALADAEKLSTSFKELNTMVRRFRFEFEKSISYINRYTIERARGRAVLENECLSLCRYMCENGIEDEKLKQKCTSAAVILFDEEELIEYASSVHSLAVSSYSRKILGDKINTRIDALSRNLTMFVLMLPQHRMNIEMRKNYNLAAIKTKDSIEQFLGFTLDNEIELIKNTHTYLYKLYFNARVVLDFNQATPPYYEGEVSGNEIVHIATHVYNPYREFRVQVIDGNAIWGLSDLKHEIQYCRPVSVLENLSISSSVIGASGNYLLMQAVSAEKPVRYKIWMSEY